MYACLSYTKLTFSCVLQAIQLFQSHFVNICNGHKRREIRVLMISRCVCVSAGALLQPTVSHRFPSASCCLPTFAGKSYMSRHGMVRHIWRDAHTDTFCFLNIRGNIFHADVLSQNYYIVTPGAFPFTSNFYILT